MNNASVKAFMEAPVEATYVKVASVESLMDASVEACHESFRGSCFRTSWLL